MFVDNTSYGIYLCRPWFSSLFLIWFFVCLRESFQWTKECICLSTWSNGEHIKLHRSQMSMLPTYFLLLLLYRGGLLLCTLPPPFRQSLSFVNNHQGRLPTIQLSTESKTRESKNKTINKLLNAWWFLTNKHRLVSCVECRDDIWRQERTNERRESKMRNGFTIHTHPRNESSEATEEADHGGEL